MAESPGRNFSVLTARKPFAGPLDRRHPLRKAAAAGRLKESALAELHTCPISRERARSKSGPPSSRELCAALGFLGHLLIKIMRVCACMCGNRACQRATFCVSNAGCTHCCTRSAVSCAQNLPPQGYYSQCKCTTFAHRE